MIIDATNLIVGRFATQVAKKALLGESVDIVNCENAVISGKRDNIIGEYMQKKQRGIPTKGPFISTLPDRFVKRIIRGMLPYKQEKGEKAFKRIKCHIGLPESLKEQKMHSISDASLSKLSSQDYVRVGELCKLIGGK